MQRGREIVCRREEHTNPLSNTKGPALQTLIQVTLYWHSIATDAQASRARQDCAVHQSLSFVAIVLAALSCATYLRRFSHILWGFMLTSFWPSILTWLLQSAELVEGRKCKDAWMEQMVRLTQTASCDCDKHHTPKHLGDKRVYLGTNQSPSSREVQANAQCKNPEQ